MSAPTLVGRFAHQSPEWHAARRGALDVSKPDPGDLTLWSVTTIIGSLDKPALLYWAAEQTAAAAIGQQATWRGMLEDCAPGCTHTSARECAAVKWLRDARLRRPRTLLSAADLGSVVHAAAETYALTGIRPDANQVADFIVAKGGRNVDVAHELAAAQVMLDLFDGWAQRFQPIYQAAEVTVYSPTYGYAGTCDGFMTVDGFRAIIDYKTTREPYDSKGQPKTPYPEVALQLAAYRHAEWAAVWRPRRVEKFRRRYYLLSTAEREQAVPVPEVDGGLCIHITPESCEAFPVQCDSRVFERFLFTQEIARWHNETSRTVIGPPIVPGGGVQ